MSWIDPTDSLGIHNLDWLQIWKIHCNSLTVAPHQHTLQLLIPGGINLLVRNVWRDIDEIARSGLYITTSANPPRTSRTFQESTHQP